MLDNLVGSNSNNSDDSDDNDTTSSGDDSSVASSLSLPSIFDNSSKNSNESDPLDSRIPAIGDTTRSADSTSNTSSDSSDSSNSSNTSEHSTHHHDCDHENPIKSNWDNNYKDYNAQKKYSNKLEKSKKEKKYKKYPIKQEKTRNIIKEAAKSSGNSKKFKIDETTFRNFVEWCLSDNNFISYNEENDLKDNHKLKISGSKPNDRIANEISSFVFGRLLTTGIGMALISTGVLSWLGILIIAYGNTPNCIMGKLKEYLGEKTLDIVDFENIENISKKMADNAEGSKGRIKDREKDLENHIKLVEKKESIFKLKDNINEFGSSLPQEQIKETVQKLKKLIEENKDPSQLPNNLYDIFKNLDFKENKKVVEKNLNDVSDFLNSNVTNFENGISFNTIPNGLSKILNSFESLLDNNRISEEDTEDSINKLDKKTEKDDNFSKNLLSNISTGDFEKKESEVDKYRRNSQSKNDFPPIGV